jgi:hypothetical protein
MARPLLVAIALAFGLAACGEREQVQQSARTYQGKRDTKAWDNAPVNLPLNHASEWTKGDQASWEQAIKARQMSQNEYQRIGR